MGALSFTGPKVSKTADQKIIEEAIKRFKACEEAESRLREQALSDLKFSLGEQWPDEIRRARENDVNGARPCLTVDKLGQYDGANFLLEQQTV